MKEKIAGILMISLVLLLVSSCSVVEGIFKAGVGVGVFFVVVIVAVIVFVISRFTSRK
ncbi:hypothetical protein [Flavobacterium sp.]|uniref:hypothetical protein n=1 Tax=Flavobacterium sp. TaxID=239 RepID=UPI00286EA51D|nr:hypothetical protein [Flavobacterium sp.]